VDGPHLWSGWEPSRNVRTIVFAAVPPACHKQRAPAVTADNHGHFEEAVGLSAPVSDLRWRSRPKLHGMQGVKGAFWKPHVLC
jgi:hypothetical protein